MQKLYHRLNNPKCFGRIDRSQRILPPVMSLSDPWLWWLALGTRCCSTCMLRISYRDEYAAWAIIITAIVFWNTFCIKYVSYGSIIIATWNGWIRNSIIGRAGTTGARIRNSIIGRAGTTGARAPSRKCTASAQVYAMGNSKDLIVYIV